MSEREIITRAEAIQRGLKRYFTGKPCKWGHVCERVVSCWNCVECARVKCHRYRLNHPERVKMLNRAGMKRRRDKNLEKAREYQRQRYAKAREQRRAEGRLRYHRNRDRIRANAARLRMKYRAALLAMEMLTNDIPS